MPKKKREPRMEKYDLVVLHCRCKQCRYEFETVTLPEMSYGLFLLRSCSGQYVAVIDSNRDAVFDECYGLVKRIIGPTTSESRAVDCFHGLLHLTCDPAPDGSSFRLIGPVCPRCRSTDVSHSDVLPPQWRQRELAPPGHSRWQAMSPDERVKVVSDALRRNGCL